jgi:hypothetical protein
VSFNYKDFLERVLWTFAQAFLGFLIAQNILDEVDWKRLLVGAAVAGGIAAAKVILAQNTGATNQGALPETPVEVQPDA